VPPVPRVRAALQLTVRRWPAARAQAQLGSQAQRRALRVRQPEQREPETVLQLQVRRRAGSGQPRFL
jgi:hypothetical protein